MSVAVTAAYEAYSVVGAAATKMRAIAVTAVSANQDIAATPTEITAEVAAGRMLRLRADGGDIYYAFYKDGTLTIDPANTTQGASPQCDVIPSGQYIDVRPPYAAVGNQKQLWSFLYYRTLTGTATLRISVCSETVENKMS